MLREQVPTPHQVRDPHNYCDMDSIRTACVFIVDRVVKGPSLAFAMKGWLEGRDRQAQKESDALLGMWPSTYCHVGKRSKEWCAAWLVRRSLAQKGCLMYI